MIKKSNASFKKRLFLTVALCIIAILQSGLRDIKQLPLGNDTPVYFAVYQNVANSSWSELFHNFTLESSEYDERDWGYPIFMKITQLLFKDFTFFMFLTAFIFITPFGMLIFKYVKSYFGIILVFLFYFSIFTNIVNSFMRQAVPLGIILFSINFIQRRQWKKYYTLMFLATTIHLSSIVTFPLYFLPKISNSRKWLSVALLLSPILVFFQTSLFNSLVAGTVYSNYMESEAVSPINYIILIYGISALAYFSFNNLGKINNCDILISGAIGTLLTLPVVFMGNTMLRISYYYALFLIPLLSVIFDSLIISKTERFLIYTITCFFFLYIIFR